MQGCRWIAGSYNRLPSYNLLFADLPAIPIVAGLAAAAAAGVGAKIYLDKKNEDDDDYEEATEGWEGDFEAEDTPEEQVLDNSDDFGYQAQTATENVALETGTDNGYQAISFDDISETH